MSSRKEKKKLKKESKILARDKKREEQRERLKEKVNKVSSSASGEFKKARRADGRAIKKSIEEKDKINTVNISDANKISKAVEGVDKTYQKFSYSVFGIFSEKYYPEPPEPDFEHILVFTDEDGSVKGMSVTPNHIGGNKFIYYDSPRAKAIFARTICFMIFMSILLISIEIQNHVPGMIGAISLLGMLSLLIGMRQTGFGIFGYPITLPAWMLMTPVDEYEEEIEDRIEYDDQGQVKSVEVKSKSEEIDGVKSPGTYIAEWLTHFNISKKAFAQRCDLELSTVIRLINDDERIWKNTDVVAKVADATSTSVEKWMEGLEDWRYVNKKK